MLLGAGNLGADAPFSGMISEVILYNRALSDSERRGVEAYLQQKYALSADTAPFRVDINFQASDPPAGAMPPGYRVDTGEVFGHRADGLW